MLAGVYAHGHRVKNLLGIIGARTVEEDAVAHLLVANTHDWALFFTDRGRVFSSKVHQVPDALSTFRQVTTDEQGRFQAGKLPPWQVQLARVFPPDEYPIVDLPLDHPHLKCERRHAHPFVMDDNHPRWASQL